MEVKADIVHGNVVYAQNGCQKRNCHSGSSWAAWKQIPHFRSWANWLVTEGSGEG